MNPRINALFKNVPEDEYQRLSAHLQLVSLVKGHDLLLPGHLSHYIYYPVGALVSMMMDMPDGYSVETYMVGNAGLVGTAALDGPSPYRANVRHTGLAYRLPGTLFKSLLPHCPAHAQAITTTMRRMGMQLAQAVVCGKRHSVEQQLIRWMLISLDRTLEDEIQMTHQEIAERLGFRREAITLALGKLTTLEYIESRRGVIALKCREGLESLVCDCYWIDQGKPKPDYNGVDMALLCSGGR
ncbi:MAG: Crp/Fnr family transcriptional regulator [Limnohabitans sp.]